MNYLNMPLPDRKPIRVLAAVSPGSFPLVSQALGDNFDIVFCTSLATAETLLDESIDIIIGGVHFDECRMFKLLRLCKSSDRVKEIAFVCIKFLEGELEEHAYEAVDIASKALGGDGFIDLYQSKKKLGENQAHNKLRNLLKTLVEVRKLQDRDSSE